MSNFAIGVDGKSIDVNIRDQIGTPVEYFITNKLNDVVVTSATKKTRIINLETGHGFLSGEYIEIQYKKDSIVKFFQKKVVSTTATNITIGSFIDEDLTPDVVLSAKRVSANLAIDGSVSAFRFSLGPCCDQIWNITKLSGGMTLAGAPDDALFGDQSALTNGIFFGNEGLLGQTYLVDITDNSEFRLSAYNVSYQPKPIGLGNYGLTVEKLFNKLGLAIQLNAKEQEEFVCYVQDDLSAIVNFNFKILGHVKNNRVEI